MYENAGQQKVSCFDLNQPVPQTNKQTNQERENVNTNHDKLAPTMLQTGVPVQHEQVVSMPTVDATTEKAQLANKKIERLVRIVVCVSITFP